MFADFLRRLTAPQPDQMADGDARLALTALLVRVARADGHFDPIEAERIDRIITTRYGLTASETQDLRKQAEALEAEAPDTVRFTRAIKDAVPHADRIAVIEALWTVVLADDARDDRENALLRLVTNLLGITDVESAMARQRVDK